MAPGLSLPLLQAAGVTRDTIVALTMPAERTAFDVASGTLQIIVLLAGLVAMIALAATAIAMRKAIHAVQGTVDKLVTDAKPLLDQATRASEEARDVLRLVRSEAEKVVAATGEVSERLLEVSDAAVERLDRVAALVDVLQDEVEDAALSTAATVRGLRVGAMAVGAALTGVERRRRRRTATLAEREAEARRAGTDEDEPEDDEDDLDPALPDAADDDEADLAAADDDADDPDDDEADGALDPRERPYFR
jgi:hypothetical protein